MNRTENSIRNSLYGIVGQFVLLLLNYISRTVFIQTMGTLYLGVNGLFSNVLTVLSLAELGVGSAIIYSMYKPIAEQDHQTINAFLSFYRKAYCYIGCFIAVIGLVLIPFLPYIIKVQEGVEHLSMIYLCYLANTVLSYFFSYKRAMISANQQEYICSIYKFCFSAVRTAMQIVILIVYKSFFGYLGVQMAFTFLENAFVARKANHLYPYIRKGYFGKDNVLSKDERKKIIKHVKALMIYKLGSTALDGTDNIIISSFISVTAVGFLSNYTLVVGTVTMFASQFSHAVVASVGNYIANESNERHELLMRRITFINFVVYGFTFVCLVSLLNPFITLWIGEKYLFDFPTVFIIALNYYIFGMMNSVWVFRSTMGLFVYGRYRPLISAVINIAVSILLAQWLGLLGVLLGTTVTRILTNVWYDPLIVYRHGLQKSPIRYYVDWCIYLAVLLADVVLIRFLISLIPLTGAIQFVISAVLACAITILSIWACFSKKDEFRYIVSTMKRYLHKFATRKIKRKPKEPYQEVADVNISKVAK